MQNALKRVTHAWVIAAGVTLSGMLFSVIASIWLAGMLHQRAQDQFLRHAESVRKNIEASLRHVRYGLAGARGMIAATGGRVDRAMFQRYVESRDFALEFPGVRGFGFIQRIKRDESDRFVAAARADGEPEFTIKGDSDYSDRYVIKYIFPREYNAAAIGLDIGWEANRRAAAERAVNSGQPAMTAPIQLVQDSQKRAGILYLLPVYRVGASLKNPAERQQALVGLVYSPVVFAEVLDPTLQGLQASILIKLIDPLADTELSTVYRSPALAGQQEPGFLAEFPLELGGRTLLLNVMSGADFDHNIDRATPWLLGALGLLLSFSAGSAAWLLISGRARALAKAAAMTQQLDQLAMVARHTTNAVLICAGDGRVRWVNHSFEQLRGIPAAMVSDRRLADALGCHDVATTERIHAAIDAGHALTGEVLSEAASGESLWLQLEIQPVGSQEGTSSDSIVIATDVTARKKLDQMKDAFVSTVSHELRTPLTAISGSLALMSSGRLGPLPVPAHGFAAQSDQRAPRAHQVAGNAGADRVQVHVGHRRKQGPLVQQHLGLEPPSWCLRHIARACLPLATCRECRASHVTGKRPQKCPHAPSSAFAILDTCSLRHFMNQLSDASRSRVSCVRRQGQAVNPNREPGRSKTDA